MKNPKLTNALVVVVFLASCSGAGNDRPAGSGGAAGSGGQNGSGGSHGSGGTGGATASGGNDGSGGGGEHSGSGGSIASGGTTGSASGGTSASGGVIGSSGGGGGGGRGASASGGASPSGGAGGNGPGSGGSAAGGAPGGRGGGVGAAGGSSGSAHWVGTWTASPYPAASDAQPPAALAGSVLRQIAHISLGGSQLRLQLSNLSGDGSVVISAVHLALCKGAAGVADSTIDTATDKALAFGGVPSVTIAQGKEVWSDPIDLTAPPLANVTVTMAIAAVPSTLTAHSGSRTTSYQLSGSTDVSMASMAVAKTTDHWYFIAGLEVMADAAAGGIVAIGDSITDGRNTDTNHNNRWTDVLAARLQMNDATKKLSMMNQGIGATNLVGTGTAAEARFARDVLGQSGVKYVIVLDGVNDIHAGTSVDSMKTVYVKLISDAHAKGLKIFGATILPFGGSTDYYTSDAEKTRQDVNTYIRSGVFDGIVDFDKAVTDGGNPPKLQAAYAKGPLEDGLHPGAAGYQKMGESVDLLLFTK